MMIWWWGPESMYKLWSRWLSLQMIFYRKLYFGIALDEENFKSILNRFDSHNKEELAAEFLRRIIAAGIDIPFKSQYQHDDNEQIKFEKKLYTYVERALKRKLNKVEKHKVSILLKILSDKHYNVISVVS